MAAPRCRLALAAAPGGLGRSLAPPHTVYGGARYRSAPHHRPGPPPALAAMPGAAGELRQLPDAASASIPGTAPMPAPNTASCCGASRPAGKPARWCSSCGIRPRPTGRARVPLCALPWRRPAGGWQTISICSFGSRAGPADRRRRPGAQAGPGRDRAAHPGCPDGRMGGRAARRWQISADPAGPRGRRPSRHVGLPGRVPGFPRLCGRGPGFISDGGLPLVFHDPDSPFRTPGLAGRTATGLWRPPGPGQGRALFLPSAVRQEGRGASRPIASASPAIPWARWQRSWRPAICRGWRRCWPSTTRRPSPGHRRRRSGPARRRPDAGRSAGGQPQAAADRHRRRGPCRGCPSICPTSSATGMREPGSIGI